MALSSALFLPLLVCFAVVAFELTMAEEKACSIGRYGALTMFNGETAEVKLPCRYRLADITCGDYRVTVSPGLGVDEVQSHRFSPVYVWVTITNTETSRGMLMFTSVTRLNQWSEGTVSNPWMKQAGSWSVVDVANYDPTLAAAVLRKDGVFSVEFSSAERSVVVTCSNREFVSKGLPETVCGDGTTTDAMFNAMITHFPQQHNMTVDAFISYVGLNNTQVIQIGTCTELASKFTSCPHKERAAIECVPIFADLSQAGCLAGSDTPLKDYYANCLTSVCDGDTSAVEPMNNYIRDNCEEKACSIGRYGELTMFNGETAEVKLPCRYRLADITCGDYRVTVSPGLGVDEVQSHRFSPVYVWVTITNTETSIGMLMFTSVTRLNQWSEGTVSNPWMKQAGSWSVVDVANYDPTLAAAVLRKDGVFSVEFSSAERSVVVTCSNREFVSKGLPETVCGDGTTTDAMFNAMITHFPQQHNMTVDAFISYVGLNNTQVIQIGTCTELASKFTSCPHKERAAIECVPIFADLSKAECLAGSDTPLKDYYADCLTSVCDGDTSAVEPMNNYIRDNCVNDDVEPWLETPCSSDGDCPADIHAECFRGQCLCTPGYYYSNGQAVCVDNCPVADQQSEFLAYAGSYLSVSGLVRTADAETVDACLAVCAADPLCLTAGFIRSRTTTCFLFSDTQPLGTPYNHNYFMTIYQPRCA